MWWGCGLAALGGSRGRAGGAGGGPGLWQREPEGRERLGVQVSGGQSGGSAGRLPRPLRKVQGGAGQKIRVSSKRRNSPIYLTHPDGLHSQNPRGRKTSQPNTQDIDPAMEPTPRSRGTRASAAEQALLQTSEPISTIHGSPVHRRQTLPWTDSEYHLLTSAAFPSRSLRPTQEGGSLAH